MTLPISFRRLVVSLPVWTLAAILSGMLLAVVIQSIRERYMHAAIEKLSAESVAEAGLVYAINRIEKTCWLSDIPDGATVVAGTRHPIDPNHCMEDSYLQYGHYLHHSGDDPDSVADYQYHDTDSATRCDLLQLPAGASFKVHAETQSYRTNGFPVWNGCLRLISTASFGRQKSVSTCQIKIPAHDNPYLLVADRWLYIDGGDPEKRMRLKGAFCCNGLTEIGLFTDIDSGSVSSRSLGNVNLRGTFSGNLVTSSVTFGSFPESTSTAAEHLAAGSGIDLRTGMIRFVSERKVDGYFPYLYRVASIWTGSMPSNPSVRQFPRCLLPGNRKDCNVADIVSMYECTSGFKGIWDDHIPLPDYPALAADQPGSLNPEALDFAYQLEQAIRGRDISGNLYISQDKAPWVYRPTSDRPLEKTLFGYTIPELDWECLKQMALDTAGTGRECGLVFDGYLELTQYLADPVNALVDHQKQSDGSMTIRLGRFSDTDDEPLEPVIFYICRSPEDKGIPDRSCFCVPFPETRLIVNGSIVSECGFDLRDYDASQIHPGRYRDFSTGRDGGVVLFCGGLPLIRADEPGKCDGLDGYSWSVDGVQSIQILGSPGIPAIASQGDIWIIDRHFPAMIEGSVYAPKGRIVISNPLLDSPAPAVAISGNLVARDIEIDGYVNLSASRINHPSTFYKLLKPDCVKRVE